MASPSQGWHGPVYCKKCDDWHFDKHTRSIVKCPSCNKELQPAYDEIAKDYTPYLFECPCTPNIMIGIG